MVTTTPTLLCPPPTTISLQKPPQIPVGSSHPSSSAFRVAPASRRTHSLEPIVIINCSSIFQNKEAMAMAALLGGGLSIGLVGPASAAVALPLLASSSSLLLLNEPSNALSLPTWAIHVSSVVEWITAMVLVWQYGEKSGNESWKGLSWGMVPLLGGAFCACTWHFFYNSEALEVLVALQAALTVIGNATMCFAAFRIYKSSGGSSKNL